jgi:deazaflavin-dependent oxidoreductase (nitroreductase family)
MPSDRTFKAMNALHRGLLKVSRGRVGGRAKKMPVLELVTTGRRTGERRSVMLTSPYQEGSTLVVVASRGGDDQHPAWYLNVLAHGDVDVVMEGRSRPMHAHAATAEERARLWPIVTERQPHYAGYQRKTAREIPLVVLAPEHAPG